MALNARAALAAVAALERCSRSFGLEAAAQKLGLMRALEHARLGSARAVLRLHEALCFVRAYPDSAEVQATAAALLQAFDQRADLRAHRAALADSGVAGTALHYRFFAGQAQWLAQHWPAQLQLDRSPGHKDAAAEDRLAAALPALLSPAEAQAVVELKPPGFATLDRLRAGSGLTDATFLLRRIAALPGDITTREVFSDALDLPYVLQWATGTPSRTNAFWPQAPIVFRREGPPRQRPDLRAELARPPRRVKVLPVRAGEELLALARSAMVTRARSLEAFSFGDPRDLLLVDDGDGLAFAFNGVLPQRRHALAATSGGLTLRNGVPIGYVQADLVGRSAALSFNTFETFRGGEAAFTFARWLAALRAVYGTESFSIEPYQLGHHNDEALSSGAWWFYAKLGFAPRDTALLKLARAEAQRLQRGSARGLRSSPATLQRLASRHLYFDLDPRRPHPHLALGELGLRAGAALSARAGADREAAVAQAAEALRQQCGGFSLRALNADQRLAWQRLAPLLALLNLQAWTEVERVALVTVAAAKGRRHERDFVAATLAHPRLLPALHTLASTPTH